LLFDGVDLGFVDVDISAVSVLIIWDEIARKLS